MKKLSFIGYYNEGIVSTVAVAGFVKMLITDFSKWKEFKSGLIDVDGKLIKTIPKISAFKNIARKIKILFKRFVPSKGYLAMLLTIYFLKNEDVISEYDQIIKDELEKSLTEEEKDLLVKVLKELLVE